MDLPYPEDIYDFGEAELTLWQQRVAEALRTFVPGSNDKWQRKAVRVQELIQTELDERISIAQISQFCVKELNSKMYQDIHSEDLPPYQSSETTPRSVQNPPVSTQDSAESTDLPSEPSVASSQGAWMSRGRMSKKEYQEFIREKLRSTQVSAGVVIGGSAVPQTKTQIRTKSTERNKVEANVERPKKSDTAKDGKPLKHAKTLNSSQPKPAEEVTKPTVGKKIGKSAESTATSAKKPSETSRNEKAKTAKSPSSHLEADKAVYAKPAISKQEKSTLSDRKEQKTPKVDSIPQSEETSKPVFAAFDERKTEKSGQVAKTSTSPELKEAQSDVCRATKVEENPVQVQETFRFLATSVPVKPAVKPLPQALLLEIEAELDTEARKLEDCSDIDRPKSAKSSLGDERIEEKSPERTTTEIDREEREKPLIVEEIKEQTSRKNSQVDTFPTVSAPKPCSDLDIPLEKEPKTQFSSDFPSEPLSSALHPSESTLSLASEETKTTPALDEEDTEEETEDTPEPTITFSVGKSVVTSDSQLPPVTLKPKPAAIPQEMLNSVQTSREERATERRKLEGKTVAEVREIVLGKPASVPTSAPASKPPKPLSRPPRPKPPTRPKPSKPLPTITDDYSDLYHTIADLYNGSRSKDFDLLGAVRNSLSMFQDLEEQMSAPDFEFQRSFKFALAPLEMDPRDFVRNGGRLDMDTSAVRPPSEKEMYYRVVRAKQEVYDIVTRSFLKKSGWTELPHGLSLRCSWNIMWTWSKPRVDFTKLLVWQRVNHFPNSKQFSRKDYLKRNIERVAKQSAKCAQTWHIIPPTFLLPKEYIAFCDEFAKYAEEDGNYWIMKPVGKSRGRGISLVKDITEVAYSEPMVIQRYLKHPLLLGGFKFDLRIYVLITALNPLEVFLYKEGFARMSTVQYTLSPDKLGNKFVHLTNSSIQKHNPNSHTDALDHSYGGTKISLETLRQRLHFQGVNFDTIWQQTREIIIKSLLAVQSEMESTPSSFDLVGYDILIDSNLKAWLIEINSSPSLARDNVLDDMVKQTLIDDTLDLISPMPFNRQKLIKVLERRVAELQKGNVGSVSQLNVDVAEALDGCKVRRYGEMPEKMGNFERVAPSALLEQLQKVMKGS